MKKTVSGLASVNLFGSWPWGRRRKQIEELKLLLEKNGSEVELRLKPRTFFFGRQITVFYDNIEIGQLPHGVAKECAIAIENGREIAARIDRVVERIHGRQVSIADIVLNFDPQ